MWQPRWVREEGLAFVSDMVYVDATEQHAGEVAVGGIFDGLLAQIARYKAAFAGGGGHVAVTPPAAPVNYAKLDKVRNLRYYNSPPWCTSALRGHCVTWFAVFGMTVRPA